MKKKLGLLAVVVALCVSCAACSQPDVQQIAKKTPYETNVGDPMFDGVTEDAAEGAPSASEMTKVEFLSMPLSDLKAFAMGNIPNFRDYMSLDEDYQMTNEKWESARKVLCFQFYGSMYTTAEDVEETDDDAPAVEYIDQIPLTATGLGITEEERALLDRTPEQFAGLSDEEIAEAAVVVYKVYGITEDADGVPITTDTITPEEIGNFREGFADCDEGATFYETLLSDFRDFNEDVSEE